MSERNIWWGMKERCSRSGKYFGKGIGVCPEWEDSFHVFLRDMGPRPSSDHSIGRIDNDGNYTPENCRWETHEQQQNNRSNNRVVKWGGHDWTVAQLARALDVNYNPLHARLQRYNWDVEVALEATQKQNAKNVKYEHDGKELTITEWATELGISYQAMLSRLNRGGDESRIFHKGNLPRGRSPSRVYEYDGVEMTLEDWAERLGVSVTTLYMRMGNGWPAERIFAPLEGGPRVLEFDGKAMNASEWARELGIPASTIHNRLAKGWPLARVLSTENFVGQTFS